MQGISKTGLDYIWFPWRTGATFEVSHRTMRGRMSPKYNQTKLLVSTEDEGVFLNGVDKICITKGMGAYIVETLRPDQSYSVDIWDEISVEMVEQVPDLR
jgi:hypothetical protein